MKQTRHERHREHHIRAPGLKPRLALLVLFQPLVFVGLRLLTVAARNNEIYGHEEQGGMRLTVES